MNKQQEQKLFILACVGCIAVTIFYSLCSGLTFMAGAYCLTILTGAVSE